MDVFNGSLSDNREDPAHSNQQKHREADGAENCLPYSIGPTNPRFQGRTSSPKRAAHSKLY